MTRYLRFKSLQLLLLLTAVGTRLNHLSFQGASILFLSFVEIVLNVNPFTLDAEQMRRRQQVVVLKRDKQRRVIVTNILYEQLTSLWSIIFFVRFKTKEGK